MLRTFKEPEIKKLHRRFVAGKPFPHLIIENILANHRPLLSALRRETFLPKENDLFSFKQTGNLYYSKLPRVREAVAAFSSKEFAQLISRISGLKLKPGAVDVFGALYEKTDYLLCHDDKLEGRKIAFVLYLSESFAKNDGGSLALLSSKGRHPSKKVVVYPPLENSLAIFSVSAKSWHEVEEVLSTKKRYTIGGWLH